MTPSDAHHVPPSRPSPVKGAAKAAVRLVALVAVLPVLLAFWLTAAVLGRNRALESASQLLSLIPGLTGQYLRRAFLGRVLARCHHSALVEFGTLFSQAG